MLNKFKYSVEVEGVRHYFNRVAPLEEIKFTEEEGEKIMAKFNGTSVGKNKTVNRSGYTAYRMADKEKLVTQVLTTMFGEPKYYGDNSQELISLAQKCDPVFVSKLARYVRKEMNMRSVSHVLTAILSNRADGKALTRQLVNDVVVRPDDLTEIMACYISMFGKPIPNSLKKGIADKLNDIDEYGFAKYKGTSKDLSMKDLLCMTHPKPKNLAQELLFGKVVEGSLETPYTWEVELSAKGNNKEVWHDLIDSGKVGYMAILRNLRNMLQAKIDAKHLDKVLSILADPEQVKKSKQLPFRFFSAYRMLEEAGLLTSKIAGALEDAITYSVDNIEKIGGKTLLAVDTSGSMRQPISSKSTVLCSDIARLFASMANSICEDAVIMTFDTRYTLCAFSAKSGVLHNMNSIAVCGGGTNLLLPFEYMLQGNIHFDRVIMFSDNEINYRYSNSRSWSSSITCQQLADEYRKKVNPDLWVHAVDLQGYGTQQFIGGKTNIIAGWSEKVLDFINLAETGVGNLISTIENY